jgi:3-hydroxyisobutyrate dehydrogenase-like beta-hydroxyacid dehydrogenase
MTTKTAFIGLGVMGYPMAAYMSQAGQQVTVYNRTTAKAEAWAIEHGGNAAPSPAKAAEAAEVVCVCVGNDDDLRSVIYGDDGVLAGMRKGAVLIDHTSASANVAREIGEKARELGISFLDAPLSGGQAGAESGALTIMVGGEQAVFDKIRPIIDVYAKAITLMGPIGAGQLTKLVNQICIAGLVQGLSEGVHFAQSAGLDIATVMQAISKGAAQSWQMENRWETMDKGEYEHGFAVDWMRKDLENCLAEAQSNGAHLPVTEIVNDYYKDVQSMGGSRWDTSSLLARLKSL